jgi:hypothetical protein
MKESKFEQKCIAELKKLPNSYWPPKGAPGAILGNADRVGCVNGYYVSLEFKPSLAETRKKTKRSALQKHTIDCVRNAYGYANYVYPENWKAVFEYLKGLANE